MSVETAWSRAGISSAMTIDFLTMGIAGFGWGAASDKFGTRPVVLSGAVLLGSGLCLASRATSLTQFQLTYGLMVGLAAGAFFAPMIAAATQWFDNNRSLAVSLVSAGMGVAPMTISPFARWLISTYDWRTAMMTVGLMAWALLIPAALLVRQAPEAPPSGAPATGASSDPGAGPSVADALRSPQFLVLALTFFACCAAHSGPIFHMVSYAMICGIAPLTAVTVYSLAGFSGLGGRLLLGVLADRFGAKHVLIGGLFVQAMSVATYLAVGQLGEFYALSVIFGLAYGGVMPLYAVLVREFFGSDQRNQTPVRAPGLLQPVRRPAHRCDTRFSEIPGVADVTIAEDGRRDRRHEVDTVGDPIQRSLDVHVERGVTRARTAKR